MSFSFRFAGTKSALKKALDKFGVQLGEDTADKPNFSRREFDQARPNIESLLDQNVHQSDTDPAYPADAWKPAYEIAAAGHAQFDAEGKRTIGSLTASVAASSVSIVTD